VDIASLTRFVEESVNFLKQHPELSCSIVFLWAFLETALMLGLFLPAEKVLIVASLLASKGTVSPLSFIACGSIGTFLGYSVSYFFGILLGEEFLLRLLKRLKVSKKDFEKTKKFVEQKGELSLVFGRFIPVVRPILPVVIGIFKPQFGKFTVYNGLGAVLWMTSYLLLGNLLEKLFSFIISHKAVSLVLSVILLALFVVWRKYGKNKELF